MRSKQYWTIVFLVVIFSFVIRIIPLFGNNFYFTMDQGHDAIKAREIWVGRKATLLGPETSIFGLYAGPLWYYFISFGYFLSNGHPAGPVILLVSLNSFLTFLIMRKLSVEVSTKVGVLIGIMLQVSWWFYDSSRYAFNPFPDTFLGFLAVFCLIDFLKGERFKYLLAALFIGLFFHTDLASAIAVNIFYLGFGIVSMIKKKLQFRDFVIALTIIFILLGPLFVYELNSNFAQTQVLIKELHNPRGVFAASSALKHVVFAVSKNLYQQIPEVGFLAFVVVILLFTRRLIQKLVNDFTKRFVLLSTLLLVTSWLFFITNSGWRDWQTSFLSPIIFVSLALALTELQDHLLIPLLLVLVVTHLNIFVGRYKTYLTTNPDPSLLTNELKTIDWAYNQSLNKSYSVYVWIPSIFDYHYQYLFWWYGRNRYGYLPCSVNTFPGSPKTYLPKGFERYEQPKGRCPTNIRLLIMEPDKNNQIDQDWYREITKRGSKIAEDKIGRLRLEKWML